MFQYSFTLLLLSRPVHPPWVLTVSSTSTSTSWPGRYRESWEVIPFSKNTNNFHVSPWSGREIPIGPVWELSEQLASDRDLLSYLSL
jgi:hypothetical protein